MRQAKFGKWSLTWVGLFILAMCAVVARAQVDTGTILGTVTDSTGAVVTGATVTITNQETAAALTITTKTDGRFEFTPLQIGKYSLVVQATSFKKETIQGVTLQVQQQALVNVLLQPGAATENLEVTEAPELLQTQDSSVGQVSKRRRLRLFR